MSTEGTGGPTIRNVEMQTNLNALLLQSSERQETLNRLEKERLTMMGQEADILRSNLETEAEILRAAEGKLSTLKNRKDLEESIAAKKKEILNIETAQADAIEDMKKSLEGTVEFENLHEEAVKAVYEQQTKQLEKLEQQKETREKIIGVLKDQLTEGGKLARYRNIEVKDGKTLNQLLEEDSLTRAEIRDITERFLAYNEEVLDIQRKVSGHTGKMAKNFGLASKHSETSLGSMIETAKQMSQMSQEGVSLDGVIGKAFGQSFGLLNIFGSIVDIIKDMVIQLDSVGKKLGASTGMGNVFQSQIMTTFDATVRGGGTMEEAAAAIGSLATGFSRFNPQAEETNEMLATTMVRLGKIGVSGDQAAKTMDFFTRSLRMTEKQSADLTVELAQMGQQMGMTSSQIINDFKAVSGDLAIYGKNSIKVFKDLEAQAKATGMQINSLVAIAKQFDQFDQAADKVAQLNAILGTQLSTIELMNMSYDERVNLIRQEVSFAAGNLEDLDQYTQQFIAQALGVSSVAEAQKMLNMSQGEYLKYQNDMAAANKRQEDLATLTQQLVPFMDQLKITLTETALALAPLVILFTSFFNIINPILPLLSHLIAIYLVLNGVMKIQNAFQIIHNALQTATLIKDKELQASMLATQGIEKGTIASKMLVGSSSFFASNGLTAMAMSATRLLFRLIPLAGVFLVLYAIFGKKINPLFVAVFHFMATGVMSLAAAFNTFAPHGAAAMAIFGGMILTLTIFVHTLKELLVTFVDSADGIFKAAGGMYAVAGAITAIGAAMLTLGPTGLIGLLTMSFAMDKMGRGLQNTASGLERISKMSTVLSNLGNNGLIAIKSEGNSVSALMGAGDVFQNFNAGKIEVEVKMPDQKDPKIDLTVELMGNPLTTLIKKVVSGGGQ